jgi:hypothetical protein
MKLPNGENASVDLAKLRDYCLSPSHYRGRHKARVFASVNVYQHDAEILREALLAAALDGEARQLDAGPYGQRYVVDLKLVRHERTIDIRSFWLVRSGENFPRCSRHAMYYERSRAPMADIEMHSTVALLEDLSQEGLARGQVGVIVGYWAPGVYEVEFSDGDGRTYALVTLKAEQLMTLLHEPAPQAA